MLHTPGDCGSSCSCCIIILQSVISLYHMYDVVSLCSHDCYYDIRCGTDESRSARWRNSENWCELSPPVGFTGKYSRIVTLFIVLYLFSQYFCLVWIFAVLFQPVVTRYTYWLIALFGKFGIYLISCQWTSWSGSLSLQALHWILLLLNIVLI